MLIEEDTLISDDADEIIEKLLKEHYVFAGTQANEQKIKSLSYSTYLKVCEYADVVLIEADGSKRKPLKFPNESEPVIYDNVDKIIVVCGLSSLNHKAKDVCHRLSLVKQCLNIDDETIIMPIHIQKLLNEGYIKPLNKKYPDKDIMIYPNQLDNLYKRVVGAFLRENKDVSIIKEEWFFNKPHLMICGAGHVGYEVYKVASFLDYDITIMDDRKELANKERFPNVSIICDNFDHLDQYLIDKGYYIVLTKDHITDYQCVYEILNHSYYYLGMIGNRIKIKGIFEKLLENGITQKQIDTIFAPIGLDINAQTPSEIAVSILAQIINEKNKHIHSYASQHLLSTLKEGVLCIIIDKKGSSPRNVGSMMFVSKDEVIDSVGGGLVENQVIQDCKDITEIEVKDYQFSRENGKNLEMVSDGSNKTLFIPLFFDIFFEKD
jgi:xanthine dehydrogenase accessory factor